MLEIGFLPLRAVDQELHEGCCLLQQPSWRSAAIGAVQLRLEVLVEVFIRVALRRVGHASSFSGNQASITLSRVALRCVQPNTIVVFKPMTRAISRQGRPNSWRRRRALSASRESFRPSILFRVNRLHGPVNHCHQNN